MFAVTREGCAMRTGHSTKRCFAATYQQRASRVSFSKTVRAFKEDAKEKADKAAQALAEARAKKRTVSIADRVFGRGRKEEEEEEDEPAVAVRSASEDVSSIDTEKLMKDLQAKYDAIENKPQFFLSVGGALVGVWFASIILGAVDKVPMIPKAFELVGLGYSGWFTYRYLLFKSSREELIKDVEALKNKITGSEE